MNRNTKRRAKAELKLRRQTVGKASGFSGLMVLMAVKSGGDLPIINTPGSGKIKVESFSGWGVVSRIATVFVWFCTQTDRQLSEPAHY
jgi:hypothetical protein